jgi:hypothetical protein
LYLLRLGISSGCGIVSPEVVELYLLKETVLLQEAAGLNVLKELIMNLMEKKAV